MPVEQQLTISQTGTVLPLSAEQITAGLNAPQPLPSIPQQAKFALIQAIGGNARISFVGGDEVQPQSGMVIIENDTIEYNGPLNDITIMADGDAPATEINVTYFNYG